MLLVTWQCCHWGDKAVLWIIGLPPRHCGKYSLKGGTRGHAILFRITPQLPRWDVLSVIVLLCSGSADSPEVSEQVSKIGFRELFVLFLLFCFVFPVLPTRVWERVGEQGREGSQRKAQLGSWILHWLFQILTGLGKEKQSINEIRKVISFEYRSSFANEDC